ncbi:S8 family serine peptidase [Paracoccus sp. (in: a-proteobacteria)]|uniref:S8 family serine peptidase n=1 Tax=Paracoccus sp. TaxID=267 RepID=UPI0026DFFECC|nr:S8 family serine peptidase [Paracoccus sp. (in: a-proteobacteria)]MDO5646607.1 S8 family serine peptidase [Paracoccus sp. (in: a-proteobacteria)]
MIPRIVIAVLMFSLALSSGWHPRDGGPVLSVAWADDDDDGSRDDDDDDDGPSLSRDRDGPRVIRRAPARQQARPAPPPPPVRADNEILTRGLTPDGLAGLVADGFTTLRETTLRDGQVLHRLQKPASLTMDQARQRVQDAGARADFNHYYRGEQGIDCRGADCPARAMIDWPRDTSCGSPPRVGMIDTALNAGHAALTDAALTIHRLDTDAAPSAAMHGTAVAALLVGAADTRSPGLMPHLPLLAVDAFHRDNTDERADAFALIAGLDWLAGQDVRIINLSLSGPDNDLLAQKVETLEQAGVLLVAAAGNGGPRAEPAFPAAYDSVLAVTAVDRREQVYRRAGRGAHIDLAAPGVDVWTAASVSGARTKTGTSFAAPFVTAAAAMLLQNEPGLNAAELRDRLRGSARDLGAAGHDDVFGHGLLTPPTGCTDN